MIDNVLEDLKQRELVAYQLSSKVSSGKIRSEQLDQFPLWYIAPKGLSLALRAWGVPKGIEFTSRLEKNCRQIGHGHRHIARLWPAWLKAAWPQADIWSGWSEVRIPGCSVIPDGLAWGRIHGYKTLFWLEVGDAHKSRKKIVRVTSRRLEQAQNFCDKSGMYLIYVQLSTRWVHECAAQACTALPNRVAVVMGNIQRFGELPVMGWGKVTMS